MTPEEVPERSMIGKTFPGGADRPTCSGMHLDSKRVSSAGWDDEQEWDGIERTSIPRYIPSKLLLIIPRKIHPVRILLIHSPPSGSTRAEARPAPSSAVRGAHPGELHLRLSARETFHFFSAELFLECGVRRRFFPAFFSAVFSCVCGCGADRHVAADFLVSDGDDDGMLWNRTFPEMLESTGIGHCSGSSLPRHSCGMPQYYHSRQTVQTARNHQIGRSIRRMISRDGVAGGDLRALSLAPVCQHSRVAVTALRTALMTSDITRWKLLTTMRAHEMISS